MEDMFKGLNDQPHLFSEDQLRNREKYFAAFFEKYPIHVAKEKLRQMYAAWAAQALDREDIEKKKRMMAFYMGMCKYLEATYILSERRKEGL